MRMWQCREEHAMRKHHESQCHADVLTHVHVGGVDKSEICPTAASLSCGSPARHLFALDVGPAVSAPLKLVEYCKQLLVHVRHSFQFPGRHASLAHTRISGQNRPHGRHSYSIEQDIADSARLPSVS